MTWYTDDRRHYWEQRALDDRQAEAARKLNKRGEFGYHDCCGMSRARGHAELCPHRLIEQESL